MESAEIFTEVSHYYDLVVEKKSRLYHVLIDQWRVTKLGENFTIWVQIGIHRIQKN